MTPFRSRKSALSLGLLVTILLIAAAYGIWWYELTSRLEDGIVKWANDQQAAGWQVSLGQIAKGGFPLNARITVSAPHIADRSGNAWSGSPVVLEIPLLAPTGVHLATAGGQRIAPAGLPPFAFSVGRAWTDIPFKGAASNEISLVIEGLAAGDVAISRLTGRFVQLARGKVNEATAQWSLALDLEQLLLPKTVDLPFGNQISKVSLQTRLMGSLGEGAPAHILGQWRDDGGTLEIDKLTLDWPPLSLEGTGTAALDSHLQPMVSSNCTIAGLAPALDQLAERRVLGRQDAAIAKLVLGALAKKGADGRPVVSLPLTIQNRVLTIGPLALLTLPEIAWQ